MLALLALFVVLARPICDISHVQGPASHGHAPAVADNFGDGAANHGEPEPCCETVDDASLVGATAAFALDAKLASVAPLAQNGSARHLGRRSPRAPIPPDRPPLSRPYHARSARLLI